MSYEQSNFGNANGGNVTTQVNNHYGVRNLGGATGVLKTEGTDNELTLYVTGEIINGSFLPQVDIPAGAVITKAVAHVTEAFVLTGTGPIIAVGTDGSEATNGASLTEAQAEATGYYDITASLAGTWDAEAAFASDTRVGVALGGTTPAVTDAGRAVIVVTYANVA